MAMMLPPQMLLRPTVPSNSVLFCAIFQFMQSRGLPVHITTDKSFHEKVAILLYRDGALQQA